MADEVYLSANLSGVRLLRARGRLNVYIIATFEQSGQSSFDPYHCRFQYTGVQQGKDIKAITLQVDGKAFAEVSGETLAVDIPAANSEVSTPVIESAKIVIELRGSFGQR
jgi:hypothetical protein